MLKKYSSYVLCFLVSLFVVALYINNFSPMVRLEWKVQDMMYSFRGEENFSSKIIMIDIDDKTLDEFGDWPWHRDRIADLLAAVGHGEPKTVLLDLYFDPDINEDTSGYTEILAGQMSWMQNVIVPYELSPSEFMKNKISTPKYLYKSSMQVNSDLGILDENSSLQTHKVFLPPDPICEYAAGLGFKYNVYDKDRKIRWEPLFAYYEGYYYPSLALMASANYLGIQPSSMVIDGGSGVNLGNKKIPTNERGEMFINYNKAGKSFSRVSASDILNERYNAANIKGKLAIISVSSEFITDYYATPVSDNLQATEKTANVLENIINSNFINRMDSAPGRDTLALLILGALFAFILPRVSIMYRLIIMIASLFLLANVNFVLFNSYKILTHSLYFGLEMLLLLMISPFLDTEFLSKLSRIQIRFKTDAESAPLPKVDISKEAMKKPRPKFEEPVSRKPVSATSPKNKTAPAKDIKEDAPTRALPDADAEAEGTRANATPPPGQVTETVGNDILENEKIEPARPVEDDFPPIEHAAIQDDSVGIQTDSGRIESLGRYKVLGVLGKGAMGTVYKGTDPAINRNVALKTIRLDFVNDQKEINELRERLSREASAAGMLSHPNIVTIYDVGSEGKLQYIAMEYVEGQTLEDMIRRKVKFNYRIIAQIVTQICAALDYAHKQGIVHRDIKPANIMVMSDYRAKVMDFGIARVDSSSMTRTGIAMGTPNYIAPEQLQGKKVDRRCDIFSLGVVLYEMLLHRRPFRGENLTALIYSIVNGEVELPSSVDKTIPLIFDRIIDKALKKDPAERYQNAGEVSASLAGFLESFTPQRSTTV
ncbi:MAG TPA: CHASE2 domain-containing protein [candidate division Zixibacteria bacterium]|nr:CHASE2 domain-containing protein [candidate division Zixibacteria bacterium]